MLSASPIVNTTPVIFVGSNLFLSRSFSIPTINFPKFLHVQAVFLCPLYMKISLPGVKTLAHISSVWIFYILLLHCLITQSTATEKSDNHVIVFPLGSNNLHIITFTNYWFLVFWVEFLRYEMYPLMCIYKSIFNHQTMFL